MKKALVFLVTIIVVILTLALTVSAVELVHSGTWGNLTWELNETTGELTISGEGEMEGHNNNSTDAWLAYKSKIKSVIIEDGVTSISGSAFYNCINLTDIVIPSTVTLFDGTSFIGCTMLENVYIDGNNKTYEVVDNVVYGYNRTCLILYPSGLKSTTYTIPNGVDYIFPYAIYNQSNLISIYIPGSVVRLGWNAFEGCNNLASINIPSGVTNISYYMFRGCSSLKNISIDSENSAYKAVDNVIYNKSGTNLIYYPMGKSDTTFTIPNGVTSIDDYAFFGCSSITSIVIPDSVIKIGDNAFKDCNGIIEKENGVSYIDKWVIACDTDVTAVNVRNGTVGIGYGAFAACRILKNITIPDSVTYIGSYAFTSCESLINVVIPDSVISIGNSAFRGCTSLTSITIGNSVTSTGIGDSAFYNCKSLYIVKFHSKELIFWLRSQNDLGMLTYYAKTLIVLNDYDITSSSYFRSTYNVVETLMINGREYLACSNHIHDWEGNDCTTNYKCWCNLEKNYDNHSFRDYISNENANCTQDSTKTAKCIRCDKTDTEIEPRTALGHDYANATCELPKICKRDGCDATDGNALGHNYDNACDDICNICEGTRTPADHVYNNTCDTKCNVCEAERQITHKYDNACDDKCNVCDAERTVSNHEYDDDCDTDCNICHKGRATEHTYDNACDGICNVCEATRTPADHVYNNTCDTECKVCDAERTIEHTYDNACDGICNVCKATRTPAEHKWAISDAAKQPTKEEQGEQKYICVVCAEEKVEPIPMLTGCGGGGGAMIALLSNSAIALVWFVLKKKH